MPPPAKWICHWRTIIYIRPTIMRDFDSFRFHFYSYGFIGINRWFRYSLIRNITKRWIPIPLCNTVSKGISCESCRPNTLDLYSQPRSQMCKTPAKRVSNWRNEQDQLTKISSREVFKNNCWKFWRIGTGYPEVTKLRERTVLPR